MTLCLLYAALAVAAPEDAGPAAAEDATEPAESGLVPRFFAGSYGRVQASSDLSGGGGAALQVATHGPRLELGPYLELDLGWVAETREGARFEVLITPALSGDLFHYDGRWGDDLALRNLYAQAERFVDAPVGVWAGSRMYRGDDIYLLDFWPLDSLNTVGGGAFWNPAGTEVAAHVGFNRLWGHDWQVQHVLVQRIDEVSGEEVLVLDRQRTLASLRVGHELPLGDLTFRVRAYGELHRLPGGQRLVDDPFQALLVEELPSDRGDLVGLQLSAWGWAPQSFVHLWVRYATGLAAFGELAIPLTGLDLDLRAAAARSFMVATAGNHEAGPVGLMWGAYVSSFVDADGIEIDFDDRWEVVGVLRPNLYLGRHVALAAEVSHQYVRPNGLNPRTNTFDRPNVTKLSLLPGIQAGRGGYTRPRIHALYTLTLLDDDARRFFSPHDTRLPEGAQHMVGIGAEWWLNSARVITPDR